MCGIIRFSENFMLKSQKCFKLFMELTTPLDMGTFAVRLILARLLRSRDVYTASTVALDADRPGVLS